MAMKGQSRREVPEKKRWSNANLMEHFLLFNRRYFDGRLPKPIFIEFSKKRGLLGEARRYRFDEGNKHDVTPGWYWSITINERIRFSRSVWARTLFHEMVHMEFPEAKCGLYSQRFNRRMKKLAKVGAFSGLW